MVSVKIEKWLKELNSEKDTPFKFLNEKICFCKFCESSFRATMKSQLIQHTKSEKHEKNKQLKAKKRLMQVQMEDVVSPHKKSKMDILGKQLCEAFLAANIPWKKLEIPRFHEFLEENIGVALPTETTLHVTHLEDCYNETMEHIKMELQDKAIWISVDETTDSVGRYVANILIGKLEKEKYNAPFLVNCAFLEKTDSSTIARLVNDTLHSLLPEFNSSLLKLFITDAAPYMIRAGKDLKVFFPSMLHVTCLAHGLHRVCEQVREMFPEVNCLISLVKKIFLKAPSRTLIWREENPSLPLPPEPVLTRWGTWIKAAIFYAQNYDAVKKVLDKLDPEQAISIEKAQDIIENASLQADLSYIDANLSFLPDILKQLEEQGLSLERSLSLMKEAKTKVGEMQGEKGRLLKKKYDGVLARNPDLKILEQISNVLGGTMNILPEIITPTDASKFKFCPTTSVDVECSFSVYKNVLSDKCHSLTKENLKKFLHATLISCFFQ